MTDPAAAVAADASRSSLALGGAAAPWACCAGSCCSGPLHPTCGLCSGVCVAYWPSHSRDRFPRRSAGVIRDIYSMLHKIRPPRFLQRGLCVWTKFNAVAEKVPSAACLAVRDALYHGTVGARHELTSCYLVQGHPAWNQEPVHSHLTCIYTNTCNNPAYRTSVSHARCCFCRHY